MYFDFEGTDMKRVETNENMRIFLSKGDSMLYDMLNLKLFKQIRDKGPDKIRIDGYLACNDSVKFQVDFSCTHNNMNYKHTIAVDGTNKKICRSTYKTFSGEKLKDETHEDISKEDIDYLFEWIRPISICIINESVPIENSIEIILNVKEEIDAK